jgi:hypothetical protein
LLIRPDRSIAFMNINAKAHSATFLHKVIAIANILDVYVVYNDIPIGLAL